MNKAERRAAQDWKRQQKVAARMSNPTRIILVRHGETDWNAEARFQGQWNKEPEPSLTPNGHKQAESVAACCASQYGAAAQIYCSDLKRARQTCEYVRQLMPEVPCAFEAPIRERNLGVLEGLLSSSADEQQPEAFSILRSGDPDARVPGGETINEFYLRAEAFINRVAAAHPGQLVIVVTHGGFLSVLHRACVGHSKGGIVMNCSIGEVHANSSSGARAVVKWNDTSHLSSAGGNPLPTKPGVL